MAVPIWPSDGVRKGRIPLYEEDTTFNEIDLRNEFRDLLDGTPSDPQRGHWVLLRRSDKRFRCTCWNEVGHGSEEYTIDNRKYDEPDENCTTCSGTGWIYNDELHITRRRLVAPPVGLAAEEIQAPVGIMNVPYVVYYFKYNVNPDQEDKIIEIDIDKNGKPVTPYSKKETLDIATVEPLRDIKGRIEYWRVAVKLEAV